MASSTTDLRPSSSKVFGRVAARHPVATYLVMAYAIGWSIFLPVVLSEEGFGLLPIRLPLMPVTAIASILGLALPALLITAATSGRSGVRALLHRCLRWRVGIYWYLIASFGLLLATLLTAIVLLGWSPLEALVREWSLLFTVFAPEVLVPFVLIQLWEEAGWTGFMQDLLQGRHGPLVASVMVAPAFVLMHLPLLLLGAPRGTSAPSLILSVVVQISVLVVIATFFRVVIAWLYNGTGRSVLVVALFHSAFNSATGSGNATSIGELISGSAVLLLIPVGVVAVAAVVITISTRGRLAYAPEHADQPAVARKG